MNPYVRIEDMVEELETVLKDGEKVKDRAWEIMAIQDEITCFVPRNHRKEFRTEMTKKFPRAMKAVKNFKEE